MKTLKTVSTAPAISKPGMNVLMRSKSSETSPSIKDSSKEKSVAVTPPKESPTVENQTMSIPSRVSVRLSGRRTKSATTKTGSLITITKSTDVPHIKALGETRIETATTTTKKNTVKPGEEVLSVKTQLKEPSVETAVPVRIKPNQRGSQEIVPIVAQNPQTFHKETKVDNINLKDSEQVEETKSKAPTPRRDKPKDVPPKDIPSKEQAHQAASPIVTSKTSDLKETLPIASPKRGTPARAQTMRTRSKNVTPHEDFTNVKSNNSSVTGTSTSIEGSTKPLPPTKVISKESPPKLTVQKVTTLKDVLLKGSLPQEALLNQASTMKINPTDPGRVEPKKTTTKAVPSKGETSQEVATTKTESNPTTKPESLPKGATPKDHTFQKSLPIERAPQKASPKNTASGRAALNVNPSKKIPTKKPSESLKVAVTKETKQQAATSGDTAQERVTPGKASVKEIVPKETMPEARLPKDKLPKKDAGKLEPPKESTTQKTTAPKAVDFPQPSSSSTPKRITSSQRAAPSTASPLHISTSPKLVPQSSVNSQGAAVSKTMTSSLTSPRRSVRSINAQNITTSSRSESESESPASVLRREPQDQSPRISSTVSPSEGKTRTPDKTDKSSLVKGTIQVTTNPRSQIKGAQQATAMTAIKATSANQETDAKRVKPKPSSSTSSSTDSFGNKITAKGEVVKTPVAEKVKQIKQNIDSSTQKLNLNSTQQGSPKTVPSSNPRKANELVSPNVRISSPPPNAFDPGPDMDFKDQDDFMNVEELMSGDVIVLDEDDGQDMSGSFEDEDLSPEDKDTPSNSEDIFAETFGNMDGIYVSEDEILRGEWIVEDTEGEVDEDPELNYEEPGFREPNSIKQEFRDSNVEEAEFEELEFVEPDFSNMLSIDEIGGSDDEEVDEEVRDDIDQVEEWEVLSEAEGD